MPSRRAALALLALVSLAALPVWAGAGQASPAARAAGAGDPERGAVVWQTHQCWSCHAFARAGSTGRAGPDLDRWLGAHAAQLGIPVDRFTAGRVAWGGRGMTAYGPGLTDQELEDVVSFVLGRAYTLPPGGVQPVPQALVPPPNLTAPPATVARWVQRQRLGREAARGASVFARTGCLGCHVYLGSGRNRHGAGALTRGPSALRTAAYWRRYVAHPERHGNRLMPAYAGLGESDLSALAAFLVESRRTRR